MLYDLSSDQSSSIRYEEQDPCPGVGAIWLTEAPCDRAGAKITTAFSSLSVVVHSPVRAHLYSHKVAGETTGL